MLPLNVPSHKQGGGKQVVSAVLHLSNPATSRPFETDRKWETDTDLWKQILSMVTTKYPTGQENKNTTEATSPLLNGNGQRRESVFLQTFLFFLSLQSKVRQKPKSQAAVMNTLHCSPLKSR